MARDDDDQDDEGDAQDSWVVGTWHCYYHVELHCVIRRHGRPAAEWHPGAQRLDWYRWRSYHAARKFARSHPSLAGYVVLNLSEIERQCEAVRQRKRAEAAAAAGRKP